jgi:KaiC/GvpD/RAD55 family RecA-like ATPase
MAADIKKTINEKFKGLPENSIVLVEMPASDNSGLNMAILANLIKLRKFSGVYLTISKPYQTLSDMMKKKKIDPKKIFFIDAISKTVGEKEKSGNCKLISNPSALTDLSIQINQSFNSKNPKFLIFDSLSAMIIYNSEIAVVRFTHYMINNLRKNKVMGVIFITKNDINKKTLSSITMFCDNIIKI